MIAHAEILAAAHARATTLAVCTTGATTLEATATGYARASGSFLSDGFRAGMEALPDGFTDESRGVIEAITALTMTIKGGRTVEASASGRTLTVPLPETFVAENERHEPVSGVPDVLEEYVPGGGPTRITNGAFGTFEALPLYLLRFRAPLLVGPDALLAYADATLAHFPPGLPLTLANGDVARVRGDLAPFPSPIHRVADRATCLVTIPLRIQSANVR